jgi:hypothetical protein
MPNMPPPYHVKTPHFSYILNMERKKDAVSDFIFFRVGNKSQPCLEGHIQMPGGNDRLSYLASTAALSKIDALEQCALEYDEKHSFGTELLFSFINAVKANYPHVKKIKLYDASFVPCDRSKGDTLDMLTYSIALYGKTWYELKAGAYPDYGQGSYNEDIRRYVSPEFKSSLGFEHILYFLRMSRNEYATNIIEKSLSKYESMYNSFKTFPEFFQALNKLVSKQEKCNFFKDWMESFIRKYVRYIRDWIIDIDHNPTLGNVLNISQVRPMGSRTRSRRQRSHKTRKQNQ